MESRASGILLHITSLFSPYGIGDLGPGAYRFADFLYQTRQRYWQVLPLTPTDSAFGNSPYSSVSAFAGDPLLISPELMLQDGFLTPNEVRPPDGLPKNQVIYSRVRESKEAMLNLAYQRFQSGKESPHYERFCAENAYWLEDFVLFKALKAHYGGKAWNEWPQGLRDRRPGPLQEAGKALTEGMERERLLQYLFFKQWFSLKGYCNQRGIRIMGDLPIYVNLDSVDVWRSPEIFKLDERRQPSFVAGVPPDYFSSTGQLWGNPVYRWEALQEAGFSWWVQRMKHSLSLFDVVRVDHFRGLVAYWEVPAHQRTAVNGRWVGVPAGDFFSTLQGHFPRLPIIAEDLGFIDSEVREIMRRFHIPGMKVLLFAFGENNPMHPYLPHNYERDCVAYTGTHDNNTIRGWCEREAKPDELRRVFRYLGREVPLGEIHWELIRLAMMSVANTVLFPMQDLLGLGEEARMNRPATSSGNWEWRLSENQLNPSLPAKLLQMTEDYGRASPPNDGR